MDSTSTPLESRAHSLNVHRSAARPGQAPRAKSPVQLPRTTAELVERMLSARCGGRH